MNYPWVRSRQEQDARDFSAVWYRNLRRTGMGWYARFVYLQAQKAQRNLWRAYMGES